MAVAAVARPQTPQSATRFEPSDKLFVHPKPEPTDLAKSSSPPKNGPDGQPVRPPSKPSKSLRLEPNPFEQSFSQSSASVPTLAERGHDRGNGPHPPDASPRLPALNSPRLSLSPSGDGAKSLSTPKPILPPVAAISSPSTAFSWQAGDLGSLRSGPLSPAMLAGPRERPTSTLPTPGGTGLTPFVTDTFRSGLTPDVQRTGLTPLVGGPVSFPPPSPNTAAFLAMVTNSSNAAAQSVLQGPEATITPNTLNALTGVLNATHPLSQVSYIPDPNYGKYYPAPQPEPARGALPPPPITSQHSQPPQPGQAPNGQNGYAPAAQSATAHAATGLFLLSQAHHELTRREEMERLAKEQAAQQQQQQQQVQLQQQQQVEHPSHRARRQSTVSISTTDTQQSPIAGKRKSLDQVPIAQQQQQQPASQARPSANSRPSKRARVSNSTKTKRGPSIMDEDELMGMDEDGYEDDMESQNGGQGMNGNGKLQTEIVKKVETDEEKRRNFLERNRQAALKCRQRKKAWLQQLQQKTEYLTAENERLQASLAGAREEVQRLTAALVSHRDCNLSHPGTGAPPLPAVAAMQHPSHAHPQHPHAHPHPHQHPQMMQGVQVQHHQTFGPVVGVQGPTPPQGQAQVQQQQAAGAGVGGGGQHAPVSVSVPVQGGPQGRGNGFGY